MKKLLIVLAIASLAACTSRTEFGPCVGVGEDKDPALIYKISAWNVFLAVIGFELILPPVFVLVDQTFCPIGKKP